MKTCFISAPARKDISVLRRVLHKLKIESILPFELPIVGENFREQIERAIHKADFCIGVLDQPNQSANVLFEIGYALGRRKPIFLIETEPFSLPQNLSGFAVARGNLQDEDQLRFVLESFLERSDSKKTHAHITEKTKPISNRSRELVRHLQDLGEHATNRELENILMEAVRASGIKIVAEASAPNKEYDFALWVDELDYITGNPVLVEVKRKLSVATARKLVNDFRKHHQAGIAKALIVVFVEGNEEALTQASQGSPLVAFFSAARLLTELEQRSVGDVIRQERNRLVHGEH